MSRSGYTEGWDMDSQWEYIMWRGRVASATRGQRGQRLLKELLASLDSMEDKRLVSGELVMEDGQCCTIGAALKDRKGVEEASKWDADGNNDALAAEFDVAECLIQEIEWMNDEGGFDKSPEGRWHRMRDWVAKQIKETA